MAVTFKDIPVNAFFLCFKEGYMKTTNGNGHNHVDNAFSFVMGMPVCFDPAWEVEQVTYGQIVKEFFPTILTRVTDG